VIDDIGNRLRRARQQRGMSVGDVARQTKLPTTVLHSIEQNHFAALPGGMFRKAYVRTVAIAVGLDPDELAADYCAQFEPPFEPAAAPVRRDALWHKLVEQLTSLPLRWILTLAAVAAVTALWFLFQSGRANAAPFA